MILTGVIATSAPAASAEALVWSDDFNTYNVVDPASAELGDTEWISYWYGWNVRFLTGNNEEGMKLADFEFGAATALDGNSTYNGMSKYNHYIHDITPSGTMLMRAFRTPAALVGDSVTPPFFGFPYFGAMISTERSYVQGYGRFETRFRIVNIFQGLHFSIWLLPSNLDWPPEIDILEVLGHEPGKWYSNIHGETPDVAMQWTDVTDPENWHVLAFERTASSLIWSLDGAVIRTSANYLTPPDIPMFFLMTYEMSGDWETGVFGGGGGLPPAGYGAPWPAVIEVDYVRAYEGPAGPPAPYVPPLDSYLTGLVGAWDFRQLKTAWGTAAVIRVKRSSDSTETDIGTVDGLLNETALTTFVGAGNGYVTKMYDQSGNGRDLVGAGPNGGYRIVNAGVVEKFNGHICARQTGTDYYATATFTAYTGTTMAAVSGIHAKSPASTSVQLLTVAGATGSGGDSASEANIFVLYDNGAAFFTYRNFVQVAIGGVPANAFSAVSSRFSGTQSILVTPGGTNSGASTAAFNVQKIYVGADNATGLLSVDSRLLTNVVWFADPGITDVEVVRDEVTAYWT